MDVSFLSTGHFYMVRFKSYLADVRVWRQEYLAKNRDLRRPFGHQLWELVQVASLNHPKGRILQASFELKGIAVEKGDGREVCKRSSYTVKWLVFVNTGFSLFSHCKCSLLKDIPVTGTPL